MKGLKGRVRRKAVSEMNYPFTFLQRLSLKKNVEKYTQGRRRGQEKEQTFISSTGQTLNYFINQSCNHSTLILQRF